jgi:hypothetical protein
MAKQIVIDISPAGSVKVDAQGFNGVGCAKATEMIEVAIGGAGQKKKTKKPEYYAPTGQNANNKLAF